MHITEEKSNTNKNNITRTELNHVLLTRNKFNVNHSKIIYYYSVHWRYEII